jgi:signal transduction histidine kinase
MDGNVCRLIFQHRPCAYAITDMDFVVGEIYDEQGLLVSEPSAGLGRALTELVPELVGSKAALVDVVAGRVSHFELPWVNRDSAEGRTVYVMMTALPYRDGSGEIVGLLHLVEDVTETGALKQQLTQQRNELRLLQGQLTRQNLELAAANAELRRLDEIKTTFVSVATHALRTPLAAIRGYVEVILDEDLGALQREQREYLQVVQKSAQRLLHITNNLVDVTRIETGRIELSLRPGDPVALVEAVVEAHRPELEAKAQHLDLQMPADVPRIWCDEARTAQILGNLLSNAIQYTAGGGSVAIRLALATEPGFVQISVADNGVGIPAEEQSQLFQLFFRAKSASQTRARGAGLGLYITRSLVELHGGQIWFESTPGHGSTFHVTFPVADTHD